MTLKSWVLGRVQQINGLTARADLAPRQAPGFESAPGAGGPAARASTGARDDRGSGGQRADPSLSDPEHLGAYAPLIGAIRDELEHFVASHVRLHLAIADRDRFLLTAIRVGSADAPESRELLNRLMREFKPEQVKRYLAREVIGGLRNAAAIDLSQFAGLIDADAGDAADAEADGGDYRELLEALRGPLPPPDAHAYRVSVLGRWTETDPARPAADHASHDAATPSTPLAGRRCEFDLEDGGGRRRVVLQTVVPGRRYVVGKGEGCDIRVDGSYTSRRHAELWLEKDAWFVADAGSTNGIRVETPVGKQDRSPSPPPADADLRPLCLIEGARLVLSARAEGPAHEYPWIALRAAASAAARITPIASMTAPKTPLTATLPARVGAGVLKITALQAGGVRTLELMPNALPMTVGRSRNQTVRVDRRHDEVSGHHVSIVAIDESGADIVVHGDNGVLIEGVAHAPGARVRWRAGETMLLGTSLQEHPPCTLTLTRQTQG